MTTFAELNWTDLNSLRGITGALARRSHQMNAPSRTTPMISALSGSGLLQPWTGPSISP